MILEDNTGKDKSKYIQVEELVFNVREHYKEYKKKQKTLEKK